MQFRTKQSRPTGWESQRQGEERLANCIWSAQGRTHREADVEAKSQRKGELGMWIAGREAVLAEETSNTKAPRCYSR